jgi:hypothetical protein
VFEAGPRLKAEVWAVWASLLCLLLSLLLRLLRLLLCLLRMLPLGVPLDIDKQLYSLYRRQQGVILVTPSLRLREERIGRRQ